LRIVDTRSLLVVKTVSLTKQFTGYEVGFNLFRFFGSDLFDINVGAKGQEPLQLGIRTALEEATMRLVAAVTHVDPASLPVEAKLGSGRDTGGDCLPRAPIAPSQSPRIAGAAFNAVPAGGDRPGDGVVQLPSSSARPSCRAPR
jgi:hypothetical protein